MVGARRVVHDHTGRSELWQLPRLLDERVRLAGAARAVHETCVEGSARARDRVARLAKVRDVVQRVVEPEDLDAVESLAEGDDDGAAARVVDGIRDCQARLGRVQIVKGGVAAQVLPRGLLGPQVSPPRTEGTGSRGIGGPQEGRNPEDLVEKRWPVASPCLCVSVAQALSESEILPE